MSAFPLHAATVFLGAFLLFLVQPIMGKFILPWFGGGSSVWTACMLFFQLALLAGYGYAHGLAGRFSPRRQATIHACLLLAGLCFLPIIPDAAWKPSPDNAQVGRILLLLAATIGVPFLALAATAPLMQVWFSMTHPGRSPYRLYALSNAGSVAALLLYPFAVEPLLTRQTQSWLWSGGMCLFAAVCAGCALRLPRPAAPVPGRAPDEAGPVPDGGDNGGGFGAWLGLSACGSVMLLATTSEISQDVAVTPYLWVLPLGIYLITFILCFDHPRWYSRRLHGPAFLAGLLTICLALFWRNSVGLYFKTALYAATLFFGCMVCHGELVRLKPRLERLTAYYLTISLGGAAGGLFVALVAPAVFNDYHEYPLSVLACAGIVGWRALSRSGKDTARLPNPARLGMAAAIVACAGILIYDAWMSRRNAVFAERNFYGAIAIHDIAAKGDIEAARYLQHDNIIHGFQVTAPEKRREPTGYYGASSGGGVMLGSFRTDRPRRVGIVGIGVGTLATYGRKGDVFRLYEIDPAVVDAATRQFTFIEDSRAEIRIVQGDARLMLENEEPQDFDVLVLDAFTSDAVPVHLLTIEAFETYRRHLSPGGVLAFHLSSQHLDLTKVVRSAAEHLDLRHLRMFEPPPRDKWWLYASEWMLVSTDAVLLDQLARSHPSTRRGGSSRTIRVWTDDFASLLSVLN